MRNRRNLDPHAADVILRVIYMRSDGTLVLQGTDGGIIKDNCVHWAPYHATAVRYPFVDRQLVERRLATRLDDGEDKCPVCDSADSEHDTWYARPALSYDTVVCDWCCNMHHLRCVGLTQLPVGDWFCPSCVSFQRPPDFRTVLARFRGGE